MTPPPESAERHRAPALWLVTAAVLGAAVVAVRVGAFEAIAVLVSTLVLAAVARLIGRGRRPEGVAVRSTWLDVTTLLGLAVALAVLMLSPGV